MTTVEKLWFLGIITRNVNEEHLNCSLEELHELGYITHILSEDDIAFLEIFGEGVELGDPEVVASETDEPAEVLENKPKKNNKKNSPASSETPEQP